MLPRLAYLGVTNALAMLRLLPTSDRAKDAENAVETARKELGRDAEFSAVLRLALRQLTR